MTVLSINSFDKLNAILDLLFDHLMLQNLSKKTRSRTKILAWYQILGGICGILITFWVLARTGQITGLVLLMLIIAIALYGFSIYCGRLLLSNEYLLGFKLTIINQALQILSFSILGYGFMYVSGCMLLGKMRFDSGLEFYFNFSLSSIWKISFNDHELPFELGINFVAIFSLYWADKLQNVINKEICGYDITSANWVATAEVTNDLDTQ